MDAVTSPQKQPPCPRPFNMAGYVLGLDRKAPDKPALEILGPDHVDVWSYDRLRGAVLGTATGLIDAGLHPGDKVLMRLGNTVEFPITYLACLAVDLIPIPTATQLTEPEVAKIIAQMAPAAIVRGDGVSCPNRPDILQINEAVLTTMQSLPPAKIVMGDPDRCGYAIYTSGTSGVARAVCHAHRAIWARRMMWNGWYGLKSNDRLLHAGAFNWTYTLGTGLMDPWSIGATALIPLPATSPNELPALIKRHNATLFAAAPGVYRQMLRGCDSLSAPTLRHGLSAGEKMTARVAADWQKKSSTPVYEAYGMSECSTFISGAPLAPAPAGASGYPQPGRKVALLGADGKPVKRGAEGVIAVHRSDPGLMLEYWNAADETQAKFVGNWFVTGDTGKMAKDGAITYLGRDDDMMNAGGFRVSPLEIEAILNTHPDIQESAVAEVSVKADTTVIAAFYQASKPLDNEIVEFAASRLARYKTPRIFEHVSELPKGANGKLLRRVLRQQYEGEND